MHAYSDVIFFPRPYVAFCYSAELTLSLENTIKPKSSRAWWAGVGAVGPFTFASIPTYGLEIATEKRHYFKPDIYKDFFFSTYCGAALMSDFNLANDIGIVPGLKFNYKASITKNLFLEPYLSLSLPLMYDFKAKVYLFPQPVITLGARIGLIKLKTRNKPT
ncbi:hypothetical protein A2Z67_01670 [Candidatus Woesebacteria bacterium RBG_13_36_22]|uniref:Outer membrane protein beta-barrel domain-containing protein n=1 Tax=Candidatus Woesebacteria bacterium RBG_13_36_22 TaxID=1802478 RepID=A0A1F7X5Q0_9BACT|nr:MAG: hypothetical protein A2Z67_01670 [Candidatus Woesebacteria bacterium RBG_13_36_22]